MGKFFTINRINLLCLIILVIISVHTGVADFAWSKFLHDSSEYQTFFISRLPRTAAIILTGATLAVGSMVLQIVLKNRFLEPNMIGASQSASLGILICAIISPGLPLLVQMGVATVASFIGIGLFLLILKRLPPHQQVMVPLTGIIFGYIIDAISTFIGYQTDMMQYLGTWINSGDFANVMAGRYELLWVTGVLCFLIYFIADRLSIVGLGKEVSTSLGINYNQMIWISFLLVALITAVVAVTVGKMPFIGLVVPNIVSRLAGDRLRQNLPSVAMLGANLLLFCDILGRVVNHPYEVPVSTLLGIFGTVLFLYLLFRKPRTRHA